MTTIPGQCGILPQWKRLLKRSRLVSVPSQNLVPSSSCANMECGEPRRLDLYGSCGAIQGAKMAHMANTLTIKAGTMGQRLTTCHTLPVSARLGRILSTVTAAWAMATSRRSPRLREESGMSGAFKRSR